MTPITDSAVLRERLLSYTWGFPGAGVEERGLQLVVVGGTLRREDGPKNPPEEGRQLGSELRSIFLQEGVRFWWLTCAWTLTSMDPDPGTCMLRPLSASARGLSFLAGV